MLVIERLRIVTWCDMNERNPVFLEVACRISRVMGHKGCLPSALFDTVAISIYRERSEIPPNGFCEERSKARLWRSLPEVSVYKRLPFKFSPTQ
jgi:hypothetical protein